jgi:hypothetical protein
MQDKKIPPHGENQGSISDKMPAGWGRANVPKLAAKFAPTPQQICRARDASFYAPSAENGSNHRFPRLAAIVRRFYRKIWQTIYDLLQADIVRFADCLRALPG